MKTILEKNSKILLEKHHQNCLFKNILKEGGGLSFSFDNKGNLKGRFYCHEKYQGYDNRIHGGIMAAVIDESMAHCLMGHGIVGVTIDLTIKYRLPVYIKHYVEIITSISDKLLDGTLYQMKAEVIQVKKIAITATGKFFTDTTKLTYRYCQDKGYLNN